MAMTFHSRREMARRLPQRRTNSNFGGTTMKHVPILAIAIAVFLGIGGWASADSRVITFETSQGYNPGTIDHQPGATPPPVGWGGQAPPGIPINPAIDQTVVAAWPGRPFSFGNQSWRISNF